MIATTTLILQTAGNGDVLDITPRVVAAVFHSGVKDGLVTIFVTGSTAGLTTGEFEPGLVADLKAAFQRLAPQGLEYQHNRLQGDDNGHAHINASLLGPSLVVPLARGKLLLGQWQQLLLVDFDVRPRQRQVVVQVLGE